MSGEPWSGASSSGLLGVREAARAHSLVRNRRGPSAWPTSGKDQGYKPMVKAFGGQRESDGVVVPLIGVQHNAPGGKGPNFDHAREVGKREGMTGMSRSNSPGKSLLAVADEEPLVASPVKVRQLQRALWAAAKQSSGRRFHALFDRICRGDVLREAWERVRENRGAAGVDRITLVAVEDYGVDRMLRELRGDLLSGRYRPAPARRVEIPKPRGGKRPLGIPTVRDRVVQAAAKIVLEPIFEADFLSCSYGFRPKRSATTAMERLRTGFIEGHMFVVEFDIANFFGEIDHDRLLMWWVGGSRIGGCSNCCGSRPSPDTGSSRSSCWWCASRCGSSRSRSLRRRPAPAATTGPCCCGRRNACCLPAGGRPDQRCRY